MRRLLLGDLWPTVTNLSKQAARVQAAIAYVSSAENLHLHAGDMLIVDASSNAIKTAQTSVKALQNYQEAGVDVLSCPRVARQTFAHRRQVNRRVGECVRFICE